MAPMPPGALRMETGHLAGAPRDLILQTDRPAGGEGKDCRIRGIRDNNQVVKSGHRKNFRLLRLQIPIRLVRRRGQEPARTAP